MEGVEGKGPGEAAPKVKMEVKAYQGGGAGMLAASGAEVMGLLEPFSTLTAGYGSCPSGCPGNSVRRQRDLVGGHGWQVNCSMPGLPVHHQLPEFHPNPNLVMQCGRPRFDSWVGKFPWRRDRLPTPVKRRRRKTLEVFLGLRRETLVSLDFCRGP